MRHIRNLLLCLLSVGGTLQAEDVNGKVVDSVTGQGIPQARVTISLQARPDYPDSTNEINYLVLLSGPDGSFACRNVPEGKVWLIPQKAGYLREATATETEAPASVTLKLTRQARIHGKITDEEGRSPRVTLTLLPSEPKPHARADYSLSQEDGQFRLTGLRAGRYALLIEPRPDSYGRIYGLQSPGTIDLVPGQDAEIEVRIQQLPVYDVRWKITCASKPTASLRREARSESLPFVYDGQWDDQSNVLTFTGVPSGVYSLIAACPDSGERISTKLTVEAANVEGPR
jgi:hypothetical protein